MFDQSPYEYRLEWGLRGAREAAERGDITIIVDVLSFSSAVITALHYGAVLFPCAPPIDRARQYAVELGAELVRSRAEAARLGGRSLSPACFGLSDRGKRIVICSLNGAACTSLAARSSAVLVGGLLNASAAADAAHRLLLRQAGAAVTVIACGEHWAAPRDDEHGLRPSLEDYLGAGAILSRLPGSKSPEAEVCAAAYEQSRARLGELLWDCGSGRELRLAGYPGDVRHCSREDLYRTVPMLKDGRFVNHWE
jgi:2-phosphosulfolactate phosphatase